MINKFCKKPLWDCTIKLAKVATGAEKADLVFAYGPNSTRVVSGALTGGMANARTEAFLDMDELVAALRRTVKAGDVLLFKGSHGMHMEIALEKLLTKEA